MQAIQELDVASMFSSYNKDLTYYALSRIDNPNDAEDIVQNTFIAAIRAKDNFQGKSSIKSWLLGILKHKILDYFRDKKRKKLVQEDEEYEHQPESVDYLQRNFDKNREQDCTPDQVLSKKEVFNLLNNAIEELPDKMRQVFMMREFDNLETETICERLNLSKSNFSVIMFRARTALRNKLAGSYHGSYFN